MILIFDADGVFLSERPYWEAALRTAWKQLGFVELSGDLFKKLAVIAFETVGLQWVAKRRGCNSNWDLTAVLERSLFSSDKRDPVDRNFRLDQLEAGLERWKLACEQLGDATSEAEDPLSRFGIARNSRQFSEVVTRFQVEYERRECQLEPNEITLDRPATLAATLDALPSQPRVCTGRPRSELENALERVQIDRRFDLARSITCSDVADELGKPHPYPLLRCLFAKSEVDDWLLREATIPRCEDLVVYVGDSPADLLAAQAATDLGVRMRYLHRNSESTTEAVVQQLNASSCFAGLIETIAELPERLTVNSR
jgi:phosphoglycolate phosphatase-like HAD superfamily hydrolase